MKQQHLTALGLVGVVLAAPTVLSYLDDSYIKNGAIFYGLSAAVTVSFFRVANLLKDGTARENEFGQGLFAGIALFIATSAAQIIPNIFKEMAEEQGLPLALTIACGSSIAGFMQSKESFVSLLEEQRDVRAYAPEYDMGRE